MTYPISRILIGISSSLAPIWYILTKADVYFPDDKDWIGSRGLLHYNIPPFNRTDAEHLLKKVSTYYFGSISRLHKPQFIPT